MRFTSIGIIFWLLFAATALFGAEEVRVFFTTQAAAAARQRPVYDVDHPAPFDPHFQSQAEWEIRAQALREQMRVALGLWPEPPRAPLNAIIHGRIERDDYTIEKVFFSSCPGHYVSGNLYRPRNRTGRLPAVLCPHGHWSKGRVTVNDDKAIDEQIKLGAEATRESAYAPQQARCAMLARMGCVVFHYDMVGYADSTAIAHRTGFNDPEAELRLQSFMGLQTWNSIRSLDFLISLPDVDARRIAVTGESGGGTQTMILCAIDDRPAVSVPAVMVSYHMQGGCICENCSDLRVNTDNVEFASLVAPRPQAMIAANDWTSDLETNGLPQIKAIYRLYGAEEKVTGKHFTFPHNYNQVSREFMYDWVNRWLELGQPTPVKEKPFQPLKPEEMSVFDEAHPRPADSADAPALRRYMTTTSDGQMAVLREQLPEYRKVAGVALRAIVQDQLPDHHDIEITEQPETQFSDGIKIRRGVLKRKRDVEQLPFVQLTPEKPNENHTLVLWVHPRGKASLIGADGTLVPAADQLLHKGIALFAVDLSGTGELAGEAPTTNPSGTYAGFTYGGYRFCYNRSVLGNRVHDLLTTIAALQTGQKTPVVDLIAFGSAGTPALLARAAATFGNRAATVGFRRTVIDLNGFDFDQVKSANDEMMIPGALKYGGVYGFAALCPNGELSFWNAPAGPLRSFAQGAAKIQLHDGPVEAEQLVADLLK